MAKRVEDLYGIIRLDDAKNVIEVDLDDCEATDADVDLLVKLPYLRTLKLHGGQLTNAGVKKLNQLPDLVDLTLHNTEMDNDGLGQLTKLTKLESLNIRRSSRMTDEGLDHLKHFPNLQYPQ